MSEEGDELLDPEEEEIKELIEEYGLDEDQAQRAQELIDEGLDEDSAVEIAESE